MNEGTLNKPSCKPLSFLLFFTAYAHLKDVFEHDISYFV